MLLPQGLKAILFDFGGVILDIEFHRSYSAFSRLGFDRIDQLFSQAAQTDLFDRFERGEIPGDEFRNELRSLACIRVSDAEFDEAWNAMIGFIPPDRIRLLLQLKNKYRILLLSNTNLIHYEKYLADLQGQHGFQDFDALFHRAYFSFRMGMKKPDPMIFDAVLRSEGLLPHEVLFVDDSVQNLPPAARLGMLAYHLSPPEDICQLFANS